LVATVTTAFLPYVYADLFICSGQPNNILRYDERTGDFLGEFIPSGSGGLNRPAGLIFGPDGNLYVTDDVTSSILRYDGVTGTPLPSPGNTGATFVPAAAVRALAAAWAVGIACGERNAIR
jgi:DNA-binding beta-propeller fold protein YncE